MARGNVMTLVDVSDREAWDGIVDYLSRVLGEVPLGTSIITLLAITAAALAFAAWSAGKREYVINEQS